MHLIKTDSCESCHQLGNAYTRTIPALFKNIDSPAQAWMRRVQSGQAGSAMLGGLSQLGPERATKEFGDWTTRIAGRVARTSAAAACGHGAQCRDHAMGLGGSQGVSARRSLHRQAQSECEREWLLSMDRPKKAAMPCRCSIKCITPPVG